MGDESKTEMGPIGVRMTRLWEPRPGQTWVLVFDLREIGGRWECEGVSIRSTDLDGEHCHTRQDHEALGAARAEGRLVSRPLRTTTLRDLPFVDLLAEARRDFAEEIHSKRPEAEEVFRRMFASATDETGAPRYTAAEAAEAAAQQQDKLAEIAGGIATDADDATKVSDSPPRGRGRPRKYGRDTLETVARIYGASFTDDFRTPHPTLAVMKHLGCSRSTATKLVMRCREEGLLGETEPGTAGGVLPADDDQGGHHGEEE